jgi:glycerol kinase
MLLFNIKTLEWDEEILKSFSVPRGILPRILPTAAAYGSYKGIPITVCAGDQQASAAAALRQKGDCVINCGTGAFALLNIGPEAAGVQGLLTSVGFNTAARPSPDFILEGPVNTAGSLFAWLNALGINFDIKDLDAFCAASKTPSWFYPALGGIGAPLWDFSLKPVICGLAPQSKKEDIIAGAMRGICFLLADIINCAARAGFEARRVYTGGGLSASVAMLKFLAGILQRPVIRVKENEAAVLGAAYIAATAAGIDADGWQAFKDYEVFEPSMPPAKAAALYARWREFAAWAQKQPR